VTTATHKEESTHFNFGEIFDFQKVPDLCTRALKARLFCLLKTSVDKPNPFIYPF